MEKKKTKKDIPFRGKYIAASHRGRVEILIDRTFQSDDDSAMMSPRYRAES